MREAHGGLMNKRSLRADVRNPLLQLPAIAGLRALPDAEREQICALLRELAGDARERAQKCWRKNKAPMAAYWKTVAVYATHTARALRRRPEGDLR
jgi:hypothetical protein